MATLDSKMNMFSLIQKQLEYRFRQALFDKILEDAMKGIEERIRAEIAPIIKELTIAGVEGYKDMAGIRDELKMYIKVVGADGKDL